MMESQKHKYKASKSIHMKMNFKRKRDLNENR